MSFQQDNVNGVVVWTGQPDCQAAHNWLLTWLSQHALPFLPHPPEQLSFSMQGNLAETLSMCVAWQFRQPSQRCFPANAQHPFSSISRPDIDLLWIGLGNQPSDDYIVIQEIKSTGGMDLSYADKLLDDYNKLFSHPRFSLQTRIQAIQAQMEWQNEDPQIIARISRIAGVSPNTCGAAVRLVPTLVHDLNSIPAAPKMLAVTATLTSRGWSNVEPWAIGITNLLDRFGRLSRGMR